MADPKVEILMLRSSLLQRGVSESQVDSLCEQASMEMEYSIMDAVSDAYAESVESGVSLGAQKYIRRYRGYCGNAIDKPKRRG